MGRDHRSSQKSARPQLADEHDIAGAARVIARAFAWHEPWGKFCFPDESIREAALAKLAEHDLRHRFVPAGCAWILEGASVALWIPPAGHPSGAQFGAGRRGPAQYETYGERARLVIANDELVESLRPDQPHWYLDTLATDPARFGEGLAGQLLDHGLAERDAGGDLVALDVHLERNRRFYERRGFEATGSGRLAGEELEVTIMLRAPSAPS